ncbi:MAG: hypothetical protein R3D53_09965 [Paracoccaceae bacterium]
MLNPADETFAQKLRRAVPGLSAEVPAPRYLEELRGRYFAPPGAAFLSGRAQPMRWPPRSSAAARVGIVPYGGGTGLVGGQIAADGPPW